MDCALKVESSLCQIVGVDVLIDENYNAWLLEINASPRTGISEKDPLNPDKRKIVEIDREIKVPMLTDVFQLGDIYRKDRSALDSIDEYRSLLRVYSNSSTTPNPELNVLLNSKLIYDFLAGGKGEKTLSQVQFTQLYHKVESLRQGMLLEEDVEIVYAYTAGRDESLMSFSDFTLGLYHLFVKYKGKLSLKPLYLLTANLYRNIGPIYDSNAEDILESLYPGFLSKIISELDLTFK